MEGVLNDYAGAVSVASSLLKRCHLCEPKWFCICVVDAFGSGGFRLKDELRRTSSRLCLTPKKRLQKLYVVKDAKKHAGRIVAHPPIAKKEQMMENFMPCLRIFENF